MPILEKFVIEYSRTKSLIGYEIPMRVYCYGCNKEVNSRCIKCGLDKSKNNMPISVCKKCGDKMICPYCGTRRFRTG